MKKTRSKILIPLLGLVMAGIACGPFSGTPVPTIEFATPDRIGTSVAGTQQALDSEPEATATSPPPADPPPTDPPATETASPTAAPVEPSPTAAFARQGGDFTAVFMPQAPDPDGVLDEWTLPALEINNVVYGSENYAGPDDLSGTVMIGWNADYLFIGLRVRDNRYVQNATGNQIFRGDFFEVILDTELEADFESGTLSADDYQLGMTLGASPDGNFPKNYLWFPFAKEGVRDDIVIAGRAIASGYEAEAIIPWAVFGISPQPGDRYGFSFAVSDNDVVGENVQEVMVSIVPTRLLTDPRTWGNILLAGP